MATYNNTIDIDYDSDGDTVKTGTEKIVAQLDAIYVVLNAIDAAYKVADAQLESDYVAADAVLAAADTALAAAYIAADAVVAEFINKVLIVSDTKATTTPGGTVSVGWQYRTLNTVEHNTITGASLALNEITLPAGTYLIEARAPGCSVKNHKAALQLQVGDLGEPVADLVIGSSANSPVAVGVAAFNTFSHITGKFTISAGQTKVKIRHYFGDTDSGGTTAAGKNYDPPGLGEIYTWAKFEKIA